MSVSSIPGDASTSELMNHDHYPLASKPVKKTTRPTRDVKEPIAEKPKTTASTPIAKPLADTPPAKVEVKPSSTPPKQEEEEKKGLGNLFGNSKKSNKGSNFLE